MTDTERQQAAVLVRLVFHAEAAGNDSLEVIPHVEVDVVVTASVLRNAGDPLAEAFGILSRCQRVARSVGLHKELLQ